MSKIIGVVIASILVVGGIFYAASSRNTSDSQDVVVNQGVEVSDSKIQSNSADSLSPSMCVSNNKEILKDFVDYSDIKSDTGILYYTEDKVRSDITTVYNDGSVLEQTLIVFPEKYYSWYSDSNEGEIVSMETMHVYRDQVSTSHLSEHVTCTDWVVDSSKFEIPGDISFTDFTI